MRLFAFILAVMICIVIPLLFYMLGSPPANTPERMRESETETSERRQENAELFRLLKETNKDAENR